MTELLKQAYDPEHFREQAHRLVDLIADHLEGSFNRRHELVLPWQDPDLRFSKWKTELGRPFDFDAFWEQAIDETIHIHHPRYLGHQVSASLPLSGLGDLVNGTLNNGSAIYEMGPVSTAMERVVIDWLANAMGFGKEASGILTSGGSLGNLTALLAARQHQSGYDHWTAGRREGFKPAVMVSSESHYSISRAVQIMGWGEEAVIRIPVDQHHRADISQLEESLRRARSDGFTVLVLVANACSTSTGTYDQVHSMADFAEKHGLWLHVDGAHGGAAAITEKYRHLARGIERADSVVIDFHKMLGVSALTTAVIFRQGRQSYETFNQKAVYILDNEEHENWFNSALRTLECTKNMMGIKVYSILKTYGPRIFSDYFTACYDLGGVFAGIIRSSGDFELPYEPEGNIVCYRYLKPGLNEEELETLTLRIRQQLLEQGRYYVVQTRINGKTYLRSAIMNPFTDEQDLRGLLDEIRHIA